jgi:hypothetical protein
MQHGEVERVDPLEIIGIEHVLRPGALGRDRAEIRLEHAQNRVQHRQAGTAEVAAGVLQPVGEVWLDQGIEDDAGGGLQLAQHAIKLRRRAHQGIDMLNRRNALILGRGRPAHRDQRLAGRIRHQVEMEKIAAHEKACPAPDVQRRCG